MTATHDHSHHDHSHHSHAHGPTEGGALDPVCGMTVDPHTAKHQATHNGHPYYFCSAGCRPSSSPIRLNISAPANRSRSSEGAIYTCPMHPEIRQEGPGACPICGMALEPLTVTADSGPNPELADMTRRFWIGLLLALPVIVLDMGAHIVGEHSWVEPSLSNYIQFAFATPVVLWAGWPFFVRGWQSLVTRNLNMFTLIAMGTGVAYVYSVVATFAPGIFPDAFLGHGGTPAVYYEAASMITVLVLVGQVLELRARDATSGAIKALLNLAPKTARRVKDDGSDEEVSLDDIHVGDSLRVRPGDKVPVDGIVLEGRSALDEIDGDRRIHARHQGKGCARHRRHAQHLRLVRHARRQDRPRHLAGADRADGGGGAAQSRADPASGRSGRRLVRAAGHRHRASRLCRMGLVRPRAALCLWPGCRRQRPHHRLPLCARPGHADVDHGRRRPRRA